MPDAAARSRRDPGSRLAWFELAVVVGLSLFVALSYYGQGLDLGTDGLWLLGTEKLIDGDGIYGQIETGDGPLRYWWLAPFLWLRDDASALALLRALGFAVAAGLGVLWLRREGVGRARWLAPPGLLALTPSDPGVALLLTTGLVLVLRPSRITMIARGLLLVLALGLDLRWAIGVLSLLLVDGMRRRFREGPAEFALGLLGGLVVLLLLVPASGELAAVARNTFVHPAYRLGQHFVEDGASRWWRTLDSGLWVHAPFSGLGTGEDLSALWPGHSPLRAAAFRLLTALSLLGPFLLALWPGRPWSRRALALAVLTSSGWILLAWGDAPSLTAAFLLPWFLILRESVHLGRRWNAVWVGLATLAWLPLSLEAGWLATRLDRSQLQTWPRAGVAVAEERERRLEEFFSRLGPATTRPMVIWPAQAGLHWLFDVPPAIRYVELGGLDLPPNTRSEALIVADPEVVLLAQSWNLTAQALRATDPVLYGTLRDRYRVGGWMRGRTDRLRLLVRLHGHESLSTLPLAQRLPLLELSVSNESSPALRRNLTVGQSFPTAEENLEGFVVRWTTQGENLEFPVRVRVWQRLGKDFDALLSARTVRIEVSGDGDRSFVRMPLEESANLELAVTLELLSAPPAEVRLQWHRHDLGGQDVDLFPQGTALLNLEPVDADLYFIVY